MGQLSGWKAIAAHLGKSERMCRYYLTWNPPLPVWQFGNGEVQANSDELDLWKKTHLRHAGSRSIAARCRKLPAAGGRRSKTSRRCA